MKKVLNNKLLFSFFAAIYFPSFLHCIMFEMFTEIASQSKQTTQICVVFVHA